MRRSGMATNARMRGTGIAAVVGLAAVGWGAASAPPAAARGCPQVSLVADTPGMAAPTDPHLLYAANFHAGAVDVFDKDFHPATLPGHFMDPKAPAGFAPFGIHNIHGRVYVTFAMQDANREDDVKGDGHGFVDVFDTEGRLIRRFASGTAAGGKLTVLNSPWGMALAPKGFARFSRVLLVGNFGSGQIAAFDRRGHLRGLIKDPAGNAITIDGLWEILFGGGGSAGDPHELYFTSGPDDENHGLFGSLEVARGRR